MDTNASGHSQVGIRMSQVHSGLPERMSQGDQVTWLVPCKFLQMVLAETKRVLKVLLQDPEGAHRHLPCLVALGGIYLPSE